MKDAEKGREFSTYGRCDMRETFWSESLKGRDRFEDLVIDVRILRQALEK
jgi:hypothetical protein